MAWQFDQEGLHQLQKFVVNQALMHAYCSMSLFDISATYVDAICGSDHVTLRLSVRHKRHTYIAI